MSSKTCAENLATYDRHLTIAFQMDVEIFLIKFEELASLKFCDFSQIWKELKFSYVNSDQSYYIFIRQFVDNCFFIIKKFIVFPRSIYTEVGALYLMYALYFKQIVKDYVKIRLTYSEYMILQNLIERLRQDQHLEPLFCYAKLVTAQAFEYVFNKKPLAPETRYIKNFTDYWDDTFQLKSDITSKLKLKEKLNEDNFLERFTKVTTEYNEALLKFSSTNPGLGIFESTIIQDIQAIIGNPDAITVDTKDSESIFDRRMEIKKRAMSSNSSTRPEVVVKMEQEEN